MSDLKSKSIDELIDIIDELEASIEEKDQAIDELQEEAVDLIVDVEQYENVDVEKIAEAAFIAGYNAKGDMCIRAWLNYKIGARI